MLTLSFPHDFLSLAVAGILLVGALYGGGHFLRHRSRAAPTAARRGGAVGLVLVAGTAALAGVLVTAQGTLNVRDLRTGYVSKECRITTNTHLLAYVDGQPGSINPSPDDFQIRRERLFEAALDKVSEYHDYFEGLINLAAIAVGIVIVTTARFFFAADKRVVELVLPRGGTALGFAACSVVALIAAYHLLFVIINGQLSLLGSGNAYCYANFEPVYSDLFWMIVFAGTTAIGGLLVLPEALRISNWK